MANAGPYANLRSTIVRIQIIVPATPSWILTNPKTSWDKSMTGQAVQFNFATDLDLVQVIGYDGSGKPITSSNRLANTTLIFYIGYLGFVTITVLFHMPWS